MTKPKISDGIKKALLVHAENRSDVFKDGFDRGARWGIEESARVIELNSEGPIDPFSCRMIQSLSKQIREIGK